MKQTFLKIYLLILFTCSLFIIRITSVYASMDEFAQEYSIGTTYSGSVKGTYGQTNEEYGERYFKFYINEKSHLQIVFKYKDRGYGCYMYNSAGKIVLKEQDLKFKQNITSGWSSARKSIDLKKGIYYIVVPDNGKYGIMSFDFKFRIDAESHIELPKGKITYLKSKKAGQVTIKCKRVGFSTGYKIQYTSNRNFYSGVKSVYIDSNSTTLKRLKKGKTYYIRICPYYCYSDGVKTFGRYSNINKIKIKK